MSAQECMSKRQFKTMSVQAVGKLESGDFAGMTMGEAAGDDYARWQVDQSSKRYQGEQGQAAMEQLTRDVGEHGVKEPLMIYPGSQDSKVPRVYDGHHRYFAAYDSGEVSRVPVTGMVKAAKAFTVYTPPDRD